MAVTNAVESIYGYIEKKCRDNFVIKILNKIPIVYLMFVSCGSLDVQLRILYPSLVNKYTHKILSTITNGKGDRVARNLILLFMGFDLPINVNC